MRRIRTVLLVVAGVFALAVSASAIVGTPEIDKANANIRLSAKPAFAVTRCAGEDGIGYLTYRGGWSGTETDVTPGSTDSLLSGALSVRNVVWTINTRTQRGVLTAQVLLTHPSAAGAVPTYAGTLTLITQRIPNADVSASARGWLAARTYTKAQPDGGSVLANIEVKITGSFAAVGGFGDSASTFNTPSYAVSTANRTC